jgi:hypothetical protein
LPILSGPVSGRPLVDFDLHGLVGIRLAGATKHDAAAVARQLGPIECQLEREPDIVVRFVDRLDGRGQLRYLGVDKAAFNDDDFLVLRAKHKARTRVRIPFEDAGGPCEIVCERGLPAVPLLIPIVNLTALAKGALPLHAAAFTFRGIGVITTGWSKGGKTESLLGFMSEGAEYVGDEWIYLSGDGRRMYGIPEPIRVWDWHLSSLPRYRASVSKTDRMRLAALRTLVRGMERVADGFGAPARFCRRSLPLVTTQLHVDLPPERVFAAPRRSLEGSPRKVFWVVSHERPEIVVEPLDPAEIAERMVFSLEEERASFLSYYHMFRFAFPKRHNALLERTEEMEREILHRVLADKDCYVAYHPHPFSIPALVEAMRPHLEDPVEEPVACVSSG